MSVVADGGTIGAVAKSAELRDRARTLALTEIRQRLEEIAKGYPKRDGNATVSIDAETIDRFLSSPTGLQNWAKYLRPIEPRRPGFAPLARALEKLEGDDLAHWETLLDRLTGPHVEGGQWRPTEGRAAELLREVTLARGEPWRALDHFIVMLGAETLGPFWRGKPTDRDLALLAVACGFDGYEANGNTPNAAIDAVRRMIKKARQRRGGNLTKSPAVRPGRPRKRGQ